MLFRLGHPSFVRRHHNTHALRRMAVVDPVKVVITNWPEGQVDSFDWDGFDGFTLDTGLMRLPFTSARMRAHLVREPPGSLHPRPGNS